MEVLASKVSNCAQIQSQTAGFEQYFQNAQIVCNHEGLRFGALQRESDQNQLERRRRQKNRRLRPSKILKTAKVSPRNLGFVGKSGTSPSLLP